MSSDCMMERWCLAIACVEKGCCVSGAKSEVVSLVELKFVASIKFIHSGTGTLL